MPLKVLFCSILLCFALELVNSVSVICYYGKWRAYEGIIPEMLDPNLCTHINYAFIGIQDNGKLKVLDHGLEIEQRLYKRVTALKRRNPTLKVLLSVGGDSSTSAFSEIARNRKKRESFVGSASYFISEFNFDGLDIDWVNPTAGDKVHYINLLKDLKGAFLLRGWLLTATVAAIPTSDDDVSSLNMYLDFINVLSYDFYGPWRNGTGQHSALFGSSVETEWEKTHLNVAAAANNWLKVGVPKNKLAIGVAFYGRSFTLENSEIHGLHAPTVGAGNDGGTATYSTICTKYNNTWTRLWDDEQKNPYNFQGNQWIGYDDKDSIQAKGKWIKSQEFFGVMVWTIDSDDVRGQCGEKQILLKELNNALNLT